jgi:hypothetical protein
MNAAHHEMTPLDDEECAEDHTFTYARHKVLTGNLYASHHMEFQNDLKVFTSRPL